MLFSLSQGKTSFQNSEGTLQPESKCAKNSGSLLQKVQFGDCERPKRNTLSFVKTMLFRILSEFSQFGIKCSTYAKEKNKPCPIVD